MYVINNPIKHNLNEFPPNCGHRLLYVGWRRLGKVISKSKRELFIISHQSYLIFKVVSVFFCSHQLRTGHWPVHQQESSKPFDTWVEQSVILTLLRWPINHPIVFGCPPVMQNENLMWAKTDYYDCLTPGFHVQMTTKIQARRNSFKFRTQTKILEKKV